MHRDGEKLLRPAVLRIRLGTEYFDMFFNKLLPSLQASNLAICCFRGKAMLTWFLGVGGANVRATSKAQLVATILGRARPRIVD